VRLVGRLARASGVRNLQRAEEAVQEAMLAALRTWPFRGLPEDPVGWLYASARNRFLDELRRAGERAESLEATEAGAGGAAARRAEPDDVADDTLRMMFLACHPALPPDARVAFTLKIVGGFGVAEIARAFLAGETAIAQRLVRARRQVQELALRFEMPPPAEMPQRLDSVLDVLYLLFNEGHAAHAGDALVRADLCEEALRLAEILVEHPSTAFPKTHALLALMLLQAARLPARTDAAGDLLLLEDQDRSRWDRGRLARGFVHLGLASEGNELTRWHVEAAIAAVHAAAPDAAHTDWPRLLALYDDLEALAPSPVVRLNRAVALARVRGPAEAIVQVEELRAGGALDAYHLLHAVESDLRRALGQIDLARAANDRALACACSAPERRLLERRRERLSSPVANA
jgi:RNA polymerase sigma-70 factor (ECF subfamily)